MEKGIYIPESVELDDARCYLRINYCTQNYYNQKYHALVPDKLKRGKGTRFVACRVRVAREFVCLHALVICAHFPVCLYA